MTAMWAAVPPKLIHPSLNQNRNASWKAGRCTAAKSSSRDIPDSDSEINMSVQKISNACKHFDIITS
jgi:hypothetical protein